VNKSDLVATVAIEAGVSKRLSGDVVEAVFEAIRRTVARGDRVSIPGFGTFERRLRSPRAARNPRTGEHVSVPATPVPAFRPGRDFRDACAGTTRKR
jgi:DNA-binding protein HU-beta